MIEKLDDIIGINEKLEIFEGYDSEIPLMQYNPEICSMELAFTPGELVELADMMIKRWQAFRDKFDSARNP